MLILPTLFLCDVFARFPLTFVSILSWYLQSGRLVFKSPWSRSWNSKSASDLVKIKNRSRKWSHKLDENGVGRMRTLPVSSDSSYDYDAYDPVKTKLSEFASRSGRTNQSHCRVYSSAYVYDSDNPVFSES